MFAFACAGICCSPYFWVTAKRSTGLRRFTMPQLHGKESHGRLLRRRRKIDGCRLEVLSLAAVNYGHDRSQSVSMNYFKSLLVGLAAVFVICLFCPALPTIVRVFTFFIKHGGEGGISVGPVSWHA